MGDLPAQGPRAELAGAAVGDRRRDPGALGVELVALAQADEHPALAAGVGDRQLAEAAARLAALQQGLELAARGVVGDVLALEDPDDDAVGVCFGRIAGSRLDVHEGADTTVPRHARDRDPLHRSHARRQARRRALLPRRDRARRHGHRGGARAGRRGAGAGGARDHGPGAAGRPGADPLAPGADQGRDPQGGLVGDDQQGVRLGPALHPVARPGHPRRRRRDRPRRRHGVDVLRALHAPQGPLRLPHGRREGDRRDDPGRPAQPVHGQADVRGGLRRRGRARAHPPGHGSLGAALAPARGRGHRRRPPARGDRAGHGQVQEGRGRGRGRRGAAARDQPRGPGQAAAAQPGRLPHRRQQPGRQRRRRRRGRGQRRVGLGPRRQAARAHHRPRPGRGRLPLPGPHAGGGVQEGAREGRAVGRRHRPVGDQRGLRLGHAELDPRPRHRRGQGQRQRRRRGHRPPDRRLGRPDPRRARAGAAPPRRRQGRRGDLLGRRSGRRRRRSRSSATAADAPPLRSPR